MVIEYNMANFVENYQSLIVGLFGFVGVIATLFVNSWLDRAQHARQVDHDRLVLRTGLLAELTLGKEMLSHQVTTFQEAQQDGSTHVLIPVTKIDLIYESILNQIGLLSVDEIKATTSAYLLMRQLPDRIRLFRDQHQTESEKEAGMIQVGGQYFKSLQRLHENYLSSIVEAIELLERDR